MNMSHIYDYYDSLVASSPAYLQGTDPHSMHRELFLPFMPDMCIEMRTCCIHPCISYS
jgi:hypothetical protein